MARILIAVLGAVAMTVVLLLAMNEIVSKFRERDGTRYFLVDFIQPVATGRQRVQRLQIPEAATQRLSPDLENVDRAVTVDRPAVEGVLIAPAPAAAPALDPSTVDGD